MLGLHIVKKSVSGSKSDICYVFQFFNQLLHGIVFLQKALSTDFAFLCVQKCLIIS